MVKMEMLASEQTLKNAFMSGQKVNAKISERRRKSGMHTVKAIAEQTQVIQVVDPLASPTKVELMSNNELHSLPAQAHITPLQYLSSGLSSLYFVQPSPIAIKILNSLIK